MDHDAKIFVAGHRGLLGSAIVRALRIAGFMNLITRSRDQLDLRDNGAVRVLFERERPDYVFLAAARVGGILANGTLPVEFLVENLAIQNSVLIAACDTQVKKLLFLGSSCIYPRMAPQPIREEYLLTGPLEPSNRAYALAKIAGIELCNACRSEYGSNFISVMPTNLYGPDDNFDLTTSHVLPALLRKIHIAKMRADTTVSVWGTGTPRREFLHVTDAADACLFLMNHYDSAEIVNVGTGEEITIGDLAQSIAEIVGYNGEIVYDTSRPDGTPRKVLDVSRLIGLGWRPCIALKAGIARVYQEVDKSAWLDPGSRPSQQGNSAFDATQNDPDLSLHGAACLPDSDRYRRERNPIQVSP
ncbi:MAG: GDP-L-fucose synthase [Cytophagales bacterium]|nr:GDP-L-fucose synthase [Armatimonadota bacterium]